MEFAERVALITGGTGEVGPTVVRAFAAAGARVVVPYRRPEGFERLWASLGDAGERVEGYRADVAEPGAVAALVDDVLRRHGAIDFLLALAGGYAGGRFVDTGLAQWDELFRRNLRPTLVCTHAVLPPMLARGFGRIVTVASRPALEPAANSSAYAAAKAAVVALTQSVARETRGSGVTINGIAPSTIDTPANRAAIPRGDPGKWVQPAQVAALLQYLCSDAAAAVNGAIIPIYGAL